MKIVVNEDNIRIDKYLSENTEYSRSYIDKLINDITVGLPAEIELRRKQYEYYRNKLLSFEELSVSE